MIRSSLAHDFVLSPNVDERRSGGRPKYLILHYTGMEDASTARDWLCNRESRVSCHYLVDESGFITQMVDEDLRAWHAGVSEWRGESDLNSLSLGIEIQNQGHTLSYTCFPRKQMSAVAALCRDILARNPIEGRNVLAHSDIAPMRKIDPGELFDWAFLHNHGIGHWVEAEAIGGGPFLQAGDRGQPVEALQAMLRLYGYGIENSGTFDPLTVAVVKAFQRHFRPSRVDGVADISTVATLHKLIGSLGEPEPQGLRHS